MGFAEGGGVFVLGGVIVAIVIIIVDEILGLFYGGDLRICLIMAPVCLMPDLDLVQLFEWAFEGIKFNLEMTFDRLYNSFLVNPNIKDKFLLKLPPLPWL